MVGIINLRSPPISFSFFFVLLPFLARATLPAALNDNILGLIVFKADLQDPFSKLASWNEDDESPCNWAGVLCDPNTNRVAELALDGLSLSGKLGRGLQQLQSLRRLSLSRNLFSGDLNPDLLQLESLRSVDLSQNSFSGPIPGTFFDQCRSLRFLSLANNQLSGEVPSNVGACSTLAALNLSSNRLTGSLPGKIWSLNALRSLDLSYNSLAGEIPAGINLMFNLRSVSLRGNRLSGSIPEDIGNCILLKSVDFGENLLSGNLPISLQKLSMCISLRLDSNSFSGELPAWIGEMKSLQILDLSSNQFSGQFPASIGNLQALEELNLSKNRFTGGSPDSMADCQNLLAADLSHNSLTGSLTPSFGELKAIEVLDFSGNQFSGSIPPEIGKAVFLKDLMLKGNYLSGEIPAAIGGCSSLSSLDLSQNNLTGSVPPTLAGLTNLQIVDLSFNKLNGTLPKQLGDLPHLLSFNISHNNFAGSLPAGNFFNAIPPSSLSDNPNLCGAAVSRSCPTSLPKPIVLDPNSSSPDPSSSSSLPAAGNLHHKKTILSISCLIAIAAASIIALGVIAVTILNLQAQTSASHSAAVPRRFSDELLSQSSPANDADSGKMIILFSGESGTQALLDKDCELGRGAFYKATLRDGGRPVAIKKLAISSLAKSREDFEREVKKLGEIQHHNNLVKLEGYHWTPSLQLLVYEYVAGGSLHSRLHDNSESGSLSWPQRFNTILGIAKSLTYLHRRGVIHRNLKSSNVMLDSSGNPKVGDYGLAKLLPVIDRYVLGYMAPEIGCRGVKITEKCDVYGFGVLVLEIVAGRKPVECVDDDVVVLCDSIRGALDEGRVEECVDGRLGGEFRAGEIVSMIKLGLICTSQVPSSRPDMAEVVSILEMIRCPQGSPPEEEEEEEELS